MDRYGLSCDIQSGMVREIPYPEGQWVRYSDVEQLQARVRELEIENEQLSSEVDNARGTMHGEISYNSELRNRVRELEELINEISPATWDDDRMKYVNVQVSRETYDQIQALKGGE